MAAVSTLYAVLQISHNTTPPLNHHHHTGTGPPPRHLHLPGGSASSIASAARDSRLSKGLGASQLDAVELPAK